MFKTPQVLRGAATLATISLTGTLLALTAAPAAHAQAPDAPQGVFARAGVNQAKVYWQPPASTGGSAITSYTVTVVGGLQSCTAIYATSCYVTGLDNGGTYAFDVVANNADGSSPPARTNAVSPAIDTKAPVLESSEVTPARLTSTGGTVTIRLRITDDLSGRRTPSGSLDANPGIVFKKGTTQVGFTRGMTRLSGDEYDGLYQVSVPIPAGTAPGKWDLSVYPIGDAAGNSGTFLTRNGFSLGTATAPGSVTATPGPDPRLRNVTVQWQPPTDNGGNVITGYEITDSEGHSWTTPAAGAGEQTFTTPGYGSISATKDVTFTVAAVNGAGAGLTASSSPYKIPAGAPEAPVVNGTSSELGTAYAWWTPPGNGGAAIESYTVTLNPAGTSVVVPAGQLSYRFEDLNPSGAYTISVAASNGLHTGPTATSPTIRPGAAPTFTQAPRFLAENGAVSMHWAANPNGGTIQRYEVLMSDNSYDPPSGQRIDIATSDTEVTYRLSPLANGKPYDFTVVAYNEFGASEQATGSATPSTISESPSLKATPGDRSVQLDWLVVENGGAPITGYEIRYGTTVVKLPASARTHIVRGLTPGKRYRFTIYARNKNGLSAPATRDAIAQGRPAAPKAPRVTIRGKTVTVRWSAPAENGVPITRYIIQGLGKRKVTVAGRTRKYVWRKAKPGRWKVTVSAVNGIGQSAPSKAVIVRVPRR